MKTKQKKKWLIEKAGVSKTVFNYCDKKGINNLFNSKKKEMFYKKNGVTTYRISYKTGMKQKIETFRKKHKIGGFRKRSYDPNPYHGNHCIVGIVEKGAKKIKEHFKDKVKLDLKRSIISEKDLNRFSKGDKVTLNKTNWFACQTENKGTVYKIDHQKKMIIIRKYRARNKGWKLKVGEEGKLKKGW